MAMSIAQFARSAGVSVETVRFYQRRGLLRDPRPSRLRDAGIRHYDESDLRALRFIRSAKLAGFTLEEIGRLLRLDAEGGRAEARDMAQRRIAALDAQIAQLQEARRQLASLAQSCAGGGAGPCPIIATFAGS